MSGTGRPHIGIHIYCILLHIQRKFYENSAFSRQWKMCCLFALNVRLIKTEISFIFIRIDLTARIQSNLSNYQFIKSKKYYPCNPFALSVEIQSFSFDVADGFFRFPYTVYHIYICLDLYRSNWLGCSDTLGSEQLNLIRLQVYRWNILVIILKKNQSILFQIVKE